MYVVVKILGSNVLAASLSLIVLILFEKVLTLSVFKDYIFATNMILMAIPMFELGAINYISSREKLTVSDVFNRRLASFTVLAVVIAIITFMKVDPIWFAILVTSYLISQVKINSAMMQYSGQWTNYAKVVFSLQALRFLGAIILIYFGLTSNIFIILLLIFSAFGSFVYSYKQVNICKLSKTAEKSTKDFKFYLMISLVVAIAMRGDQFIIEKYLSEELYVTYALAFQLSMLFPMLTGALISYYITKSEFTATSGTILCFIMIFLILMYLPLAHLIDRVAELVLDNAFIGLGSITAIFIITHVTGLFFIKNETYITRKSPQKILSLKLVQMILVLSGSYFSIVQGDLRYCAVLVYASRMLGWGYCYYVVHKTNLSEA